MIDRDERERERRDEEMSPFFLGRVINTKHDMDRQDGERCIHGAGAKESGGERLSISYHPHQSRSRL